MTVLQICQHHIYNNREARDQDARLAEEEWKLADEHLKRICASNCMWSPIDQQRFQLAAERRSAALERMVKAGKD